MSGGTVIEQEFGAPRVRVAVRRGPLAIPVLVRSIAMFAARTSLPANRLDDICDVLEGLAASLPGERITIEARFDRGGSGLQLHVSELAGGTARSVLSDVRHGGLARLLAVTSEGVAVRSSSTRGESLIVTFAPPR